MINFSVFGGCQPRPLIFPQLFLRGTNWNGMVPLHVKELTQTTTTVTTRTADANNLDRFRWEWNGKNHCESFLIVFYLGLNAVYTR